MNTETQLIIAALLGWYLIGLLCMLYVKYRNKKRSRGIEQAANVDVYGMAFMGPVLLLSMFYWTVASIIRKRRHKKRNQLGLIASMAKKRNQKRRNRGK